MKGETFREHTMARLDAHDGELGVDTKAAGRQLGEGSAGPAGYLESGGGTASNPYGVTQGQSSEQAYGGMAGSSGTSADARMWHYEYEGNSVGPISERQLLEMIRAGQIVGSTLLWTEDLGDWRAARDIRALSSHLGQSS